MDNLLFFSPSLSVCCVVKLVMKLVVIVMDVLMVAVVEVMVVEG